ncbi:MAG: hypothetical protein ACRD2L_01665 [Terriglobia bacterium]
MSFGAIFSLINAIVPAIQTAERFIRGRGRGDEKLDAVVQEVTSAVSGFARAIPDEGARQQFDWAGLLRDSPEFTKKLAVVVSAIVDLYNFVRKYEKN